MEGSFSLRAEAVEQACLAARHFADRCGRCVLLVPSYEETVQIKHELAKTQRGFGVAVETPSSWMEDLWETHGDGRAFVAPMERSLLVRKAMDACGMRKTPGMVKLVSDLARVALPFALSRPEGVAGEERAACECLDVYAQEILSRGLVEQSDACVQLSQLGALSGLCVVDLGCQLTKAQTELLSGASVKRFAVDATLLREGSSQDAELEDLRMKLFHPDFENPVQPQGQVRFFLPSGEYAQTRLLADQIEEMAQRLAVHAGGENQVRIALAAKDPQAAYDQLATALQAKGFSVNALVSVPFSRTPFGRAWLSLRAFLDVEDPLEKGLAFQRSGFAGDFTASLFSFMGQRQARDVDRRIRSWRGKTVDDALTDVSCYSYEEHRDFIAYMEKGNLEAALQVQAAWIATREKWPQWFRAQQQAAVAAAQEAYAKGADYGLDEQDILAALQGVRIRTSILAGETHGPCVNIMRMDQLAQQEKESFDGVVVMDLTADAYPLKDEKRALDHLLELLKAQGEGDAIAAQRLAFFQSLEAARFEVALCRALNSVDANELRPAALLEELIDCYRSKPQDADELDKLLGVPEPLKPFTFTLGEECLSENIAAAEGFDGAQSETLHRTPVGLLFGLDKPRVFDFGGGTRRLSPLAIESYLECPYKWFASRRLKLSEIDADFGPRAFGTFSHNVLEEFHGLMLDNGLGRVTPSNAEEALEVLDVAYHRVLEKDASSYSSDALIALTQTERLRVEGVRRTLEDYVRWEANFLPDFVPYRAELSFGKGEDVFEYAGVAITGRVDRVDTDGFGHAAVIDYKGSVGKSYDFRVKGAEEWQLPRKVQAAIYAQVVRKRFHMDPVAALYVSYSNPGSISGLYDLTALHPDRDLLGIKADLCGAADMLDQLDRCEEAIAGHLENMRLGNVQPCPLDQDACKYCPVAACERRLG